MKELVSDFSHHKIKIYYLKHYYEQNLYQILISIRVRIISFKKGNYFDSEFSFGLSLNKLNQRFQPTDGYKSSFYQK